MVECQNGFQTVSTSRDFLAFDHHLLLLQVLSDFSIDDLHTVIMPPLLEAGEWALENLKIIVYLNFFY